MFLGGKYTFKIIELHKQYGPILRISPWEIHVSDPDFYDVIYASSASNLKRDKYEWFSKSFGQDKSAFGTHDHDLHKLRRSALNPFFSLQNVRRLQPVILERVHILLDRFREFRESGKVLNASCASSAFTNGLSMIPNYIRLLLILVSIDIVMQFSFSRCDNRLSEPPQKVNYLFCGKTDQVMQRLLTLTLPIVMLHSLALHQTIFSSMHHGSIISCNRYLIQLHSFCTR